VLIKILSKTSLGIEGAAPPFHVFLARLLFKKLYIRDRPQMLLPSMLPQKGKDHYREFFMSQILSHLRSYDCQYL